MSQYNVEITKQYQASMASAALVSQPLLVSQSWNLAWNFDLSATMRNRKYFTAQNRQINSLFHLEVEGCSRLLLALQSESCMQI